MSAQFLITSDRTFQAHLYAPLRSPGFLCGPVLREQAGPWVAFIKSDEFKAKVMWTFIPQGRKYSWEMSKIPPSSVEKHPQNYMEMWETH